MMDLKVFLLLSNVLQVLSQVSTVNISPSGTFISYIGGNATFKCHANSIYPANTIDIIGNGTVFSGNETGISVNQYDGNRIKKLIIYNLTAEHNLTDFTCNATFRHGSVSSVTSARLLIQGALQEVISPMVTIKSGMLFINWTAPFTLDIRDTNNDITYCVKVENCTSSYLCHQTIYDNECNIAMSEIIINITKSSPCYFLNITITPDNKVGRGKSKTVTYRDQNRPNISGEISRKRLSPMTFDFKFPMSAPVCVSNVTLVDNDTGEAVTLEETDLTIVDTNITFTSQKLKENRHYNVNITASNTAGLETSEAKISTHDIRNATVTEVIIETNYFENSSASGAFYIFVPLRIANLTRAVYLALDRNTSHSYTLPFSLSAGRLAVFVYDIESDGTLASGVGYPAVIRELVISESAQDSLLQPSYTFLESCEVIIAAFNITVKCTYPDNSSATGFQIVAHLSNSSEVHKLYINKTTDRQTPASVVVEKNGTYQVTVFAIRGDGGIVDSNVEHMAHLDVPHTDSNMETLLTTVTIAVVGVVFIIIIASMATYYTYYKCHKYNHYKPHSQRIPEKNNKSTHGSGPHEESQNIGPQEETNEGQKTITKPVFIKPKMTEESYVYHHMVSQCTSNQGSSEEGNTSEHTTCLTAPKQETFRRKYEPGKNAILRDDSRLDPPNEDGIHASTVKHSHEETSINLDGDSYIGDY